MPKRTQRKPREDGATALYLLFDEEHEPLYVGISHRPLGRWRERGGDKPWWPAVRYRSLIWFSCRAEAVVAEQAAIEAMCPPHNRVIHPQSVPPPPGGRPLAAANRMFRETHRDLVDGVIRALEGGAELGLVAHLSGWSPKYIKRLHEERLVKARRPKRD
jgi:hypothetical protein